MSTLSPHPGDQQEFTGSAQQRKGEEERPVGIIQWWYRVSSPPEPGASAPFQERDLFRRGRTGSQISFFLFLLILTSFPAAFAGSNSLLVIILAISLCVLIVALILNRLKMVNLAGVLVVLSVISGPTANILTTPGGVNTSALPIFGFLVLPVMCAVSFLPPLWVFAVAAVDSLFAFLVLKFFPSTGDLHTVLQTAFPGIVTPVILSQWIVAIIAFLWVTGARSAILRADRAEEIAALEQREIEQQHLQIEQKQRLDADIQLILQTHVQVANGNFTARAPLGRENVLWQIAYSLNNLLARLQSYTQIRAQYERLQEENFQLRNAMQSNGTTQQELQRTKEAASQLVQMMKRSKDGSLPIASWHSGTVIDTVAAEVASTMSTQTAFKRKQEGL
jgi:hypothetical protein